MITFSHKGDLSKTRNFLKRCQKLDLSFLDKFGEEGVIALGEATPEDTGTTANSWYYKIVNDEKSYTIQWLNSNIQDGVLIAIILQYGHATGTGGYVEGIDYINPAIRPIFERIAKNAWREVRRK